MMPFASIETRWFFEGGSERHPRLQRWFETCAPFPQAEDVSAPEWKGRAGGEPDVYLLMPACVDMGVR
jgi:glutathione S-transferase